MCLIFIYFIYYRQTLIKKIKKLKDIYFEKIDAKLIAIKVE